MRACLTCVFVIAHRGSSAYRVCVWPRVWWPKDLLEYRPKTHFSTTVVLSERKTTHAPVHPSSLLLLSLASRSPGACPTGPLDPVRGGTTRPWVVSTLCLRLSLLDCPCYMLYFISEVSAESGDSPLPPPASCPLPLLRLGAGADKHLLFTATFTEICGAHASPNRAPLHYGTPPTSIPYHQRRRGNLLTAVDTASLAPFLTMRLTGAMSSAPYARLVWIATRLAGLGNTWSGLGLGKG